MSSSNFSDYELPIFKSVSDKASQTTEPSQQNECISPEAAFRAHPTQRLVRLSPDLLQYMARYGREMHSDNSTAEDFSLDDIVYFRAASLTKLIRDKVHSELDKYYESGSFIDRDDVDDLILNCLREKVSSMSDHNLVPVPNKALKNHDLQKSSSTQTDEGIVTSVCEFDYKEDDEPKQQEQPEISSSEADYSTPYSNSQDQLTEESTEEDSETEDMNVFIRTLREVGKDFLVEENFLLLEQRLVWLEQQIGAIIKSRPWLQKKAAELCFDRTDLKASMTKLVESLEDIANKEDEQKTEKTQDGEPATSSRPDKYDMMYKQHRQFAINMFTYKKSATSLALNEKSLAHNVFTMKPGNRYW